MKPIMVALLLFMLLYLIADIFVKHASFGLFQEMIAFTLFGNEDEFLDPINPASFLEFWHTEIFFIMMLLLTLSTVFIRMAEKTKIKLIIVNTLMLSSFISLIALALSFFVTSAFIDIYVITFFIWHACALYMILYSLWKLNDNSL